MNAGKLLFAQLMDFLPWTSFARSVARYGGDHRAHNLSCTEQFRALTFQAHSTLCCKSSQLLCSRKYPFRRHFSRRTTQIS